MPQGRRVPKRSLRDYLFMALGVAALAGLAYAAYATFAPDKGERAISDFGDVHGLAVHPTDSNVLFVATHYGLVRGENGTWTRVGPDDDLMGFTMSPQNANVVWSSGHPRLKTLDHHNLGVRKSTDGGHSWSEIAMKGADFHAMTISPADPENLWGFYGGKLYASTDAGASWRVVNASPPSVVSLAAHPQEPLTVFAATPQGIWRSVDGGASWSLFAPVPAFGLAIDPANNATVYAAGAQGVQKSTDAGATWSPLSLQAPGQTPAYLAISPSFPSVVYLATFEAGIYKTTHAGASWEQIKAPTR
jgi:hypothetical protein